MPQRFIKYFVQQINKSETLPYTTMKINYTIKIGSVALATLLTALMNSCASHETGVVTPVNLPKVQHTLAAPKSLEGAWIRLRVHGSSSPESYVVWWYMKNGEAYYYGDETVAENGHPVSPTSMGTPEYGSMRIPHCEDNLGRSYLLTYHTYVPSGATAKLYIENNDRHGTTLCRSVPIEDDYVYSIPKEPAVITFKSENQGVYEGSLKGCLAPEGPASWVRYVDSITIFTK